MLLKQATDAILCGLDALIVLAAARIHVHRAASLDILHVVHERQQAVHTDGWEGHP